MSQSELEIEPTDPLQWDPPCGAVVNALSPVAETDPDSFEEEEEFEDEPLEEEEEEFDEEDFDDDFDDDFEEELDDDLDLDDDMDEEAEGKDANGAIGGDFDDE
jgi:hypothetical protein